MRTVVVTGGTDGIGKGLALHYLRQGARVVAVGSTPAKGASFLAEAASQNATFLRADLTSIAATKELLATIRRTCASLDTLVLCAQRYRLFGPRTTTREGFEHSFALAYLSRHILSHGLRDLMTPAPHPVIMNVGTPGVPLGRIHWDDLQLTRRYNGTRATLQSFRANDLLGVAFGELYGGEIRYVGYNPGVVSTGMPTHLPATLRAAVRATFPLVATSVAKAVMPMTTLLEDPPAEAFSAYFTKRRLSLGGAAFDRDEAMRLHHLTQRLIDAGAPTLPSRP